MDIQKILFMTEAHEARLERTIVRLWVVIIILLLLLFGTNAGWMYYENQFEDVTTTVTQEVDAKAEGDSDLSLNTIGGDYNGGESESQTDSNN